MASTESMRLELTWPNKDKFLLSPKDETGKPIWVDRSHPAASEVRLVDFTGSYGEVAPEAQRVSDNLLFTGDSLDVLRVLAEHPEFRREYCGKVKCVYIDPPFNTGQAFHHYDDWLEHSTWLSFMRDRLMLIRELLSSDGTVWVHLDDAEAHRMRCLLDEVFGANNFVAQLAVELNPKGRQLDRFFAGSNDVVLVYASDLRQASLVCGSSDDVKLSDFPQRTADGLPYRFLPLRNTNKKFNPTTARTMTYPLYVNQETGEVAADQPPGTAWRVVLPVFGDGTDAVWRWSAKLVRERGAELMGRQVNGRLGSRLDVFQLDYLGTERTKKLKTIWLSADVGSSDIAKREIKALMLSDGITFDTPKPERLMARIIEIATSPGDVVLDVFAGSGTTAAVAHKLGRRWITGELAQATVSRFTEPRLRKVVAGKDPGGVSDRGWIGGGGYRTAAVGRTMYEVADDGTPLLSIHATNGAFARAVAAQLDFDFDEFTRPFCGRRGRMRLAVLDGAVGPEEVRSITAALSENERATIVAKVVLPGAEEMLASLSKGSRIRKAPRDVLADGTRRTRRRETAR